MSRLAYVKDEIRLAQYLNQVGFQKELAIGYGSRGTQVFVASKQSDNLAVVAFRGTEPDDPSDLFADANFIMTPWTDNSGGESGKVHEGFAMALLANDILKKNHNLSGFAGSSNPCINYWTQPGSRASHLNRQSETVFLSLYFWLIPCRGHCLCRSRVKHKP
jgi:hypothetical protein